jgi:hypothetical protein
MTPNPRSRMRFADDDPERRTRLRLDFLIALMLVQIVLSIGLWVDRYRTREQPVQQPVQSQATQPSSIDPYAETSVTRDNGTADVRLPETAQAQAPAQQPQTYTPPQIKVQILNGCGKTGIAKKAREYLTKNNYEVRDVGNADRQDYRFSEVLNRSGSATAARDLAKLLGIDDSRIKKKPASPGLDVDLTLIIGADTRRLPFGR